MKDQASGHHLQSPNRHEDWRVEGYHRKRIWKGSIVYMLEGRIKEEANSKSCLTLKLEFFFIEQVGARSSISKFELPLELLETMLRTSQISHRKFSIPIPAHASFLFSCIQNPRDYFYARLRSRPNLGLRFLLACTPRLLSTHCFS